MSEEETTAEASFDAKISKLGDEIAGLTLKEAVDLTDYMKATYGIEPAAGGAVMVAGGAMAAAAVPKRRRPSSTSSSRARATRRSRSSRRSARSPAWA